MPLTIKNKQTERAKSENPTIKSTETLFTDLIKPKCEIFCEKKIEPVIVKEVRPALIQPTYQKLESLENYIDVFFEAGNIYDVDPYLLLAIAQLESVFGKSIPYNSYNPFGRTCDRRYYECVSATDATEGVEIYWNKYSSWEESIMDEGYYLKTYYLNKGLTTPKLIGTKYATDSMWAFKIEVMMIKFQEKYPSL